ncbi:hypothetical protein E8E11_011287 [Didymella keratinophila]|nr:hypothetical protein E8E11_011287 [Didymella keratinophila]
MGNGLVVASATSTLDHTWTIGHGPAMSSPTAASFWTTGHGPVVPEPTSTESLLRVATKATSPPASTLATVVKRSAAALNTSEVTCRPLVTQNLNDLLGCHTNDDNWIYFTLMKPDGSIALSLQGKHVLYFVSKEWTLTYPDRICKSFLNDPSSNPTCSEDHCRSALIPGIDLCLSLVKSPKALRSGGSTDSCGYVNDVHTIEQHLVTRAKFGYLNNGITVDDAIIPFIEQ